MATIQAIEPAVALSFQLSDDFPHGPLFRNAIANEATDVHSNKMDWFASGF